MNYGRACLVTSLSIQAVFQSHLLSKEEGLNMFLKNLRGGEVDATKDRTGRSSIPPPPPSLRRIRTFSSGAAQATILLPSHLLHLSSAQCRMVLWTGTEFHSPCPLNWSAKDFASLGFQIIGRAKHSVTPQLSETTALIYCLQNCKTHKDKSYESELEYLKLP